MSAETRDTLLHGQLQDGLKHELMRAAAVSGAQSYKGLCLAARNEEKRLAELKKRQQYLKSSVTSTTARQTAKNVSERKPFMPPSNRTGQTEMKCFLCRKPGHLARDCRSRTTESSGRDVYGKTASGTKQVSADGDTLVAGQLDSLTQFLYSSDEETAAGVSVVRVADKGSKPQCAKVLVLQYLGPGVWVLAGTHASKLSGKDCVCHTPGIIRVSSHALWANQCTRSFSAAHGECFGRTEP